MTYLQQSAWRVTSFLCTSLGVDDTECSICICIHSVDRHICRYHYVSPYVLEAVFFPLQHSPNLGMNISCSSVFGCGDASLAMKHMLITMNSLMDAQSTIEGKLLPTAFTDKLVGHMYIWMCSEWVWCPESFWTYLTLEDCFVVNLMVYIPCFQSVKSFLTVLFLALKIIFSSIAPQSVCVDLKTRLSWFFLFHLMFGSHYIMRFTALQWSSNGQ